MIKYMITNSAIIIPTKEKTYQISKSDIDKFNEILSICKEKESKIQEIFDIFSENIFSENNNVSYEYNKENNRSEIYYQGKYFITTNYFVPYFVILKQTGRNKSISNFIEKLLKTECDLDIIGRELTSNGFFFCDNGNIFLGKTNNDNHEKINEPLEKEREIINFQDKINISLIEVNPENLFIKDNKLFVNKYIKFYDFINTNPIMKTHYGNLYTKDNLIKLFKEVNNV